MIFSIMKIYSSWKKGKLTTEEGNFFHIRNKNIKTARRRKKKTKKRKRKEKEKESKER